jgi:hypothetical protein
MPMTKPTPTLKPKPNANAKSVGQSFWLSKHKNKKNILRYKT